MGILTGSQTFQFIIRIVQTTLAIAGMRLLFSYHQDLDSFVPNPPFANYFYIQVLLIVFGLTIVASILLLLFALQKLEFGFLGARKGGLLLSLEVLVWGSWIGAVYTLWVKVKGAGCMRSYKGPCSLMMPLDIIGLVEFFLYTVIVLFMCSNWRNSSKGVGDEEFGGPPDAFGGPDPFGGPPMGPPGRY